MQDTSWDLETPEKAELGSDTLEQSLLPWLNVVMHETTLLLQCLDELFLVYFSYVVLLAVCSFWLYIQHDRIVQAYVQGQSVKSLPGKLLSESKSLSSGSCRKNMAVLKLIGLWCIINLAEARFTMHQMYKIDESGPAESAGTTVSGSFIA